jgi:hypothetical protein
MSDAIFTSLSGCDAVSNLSEREKDIYGVGGSSYVTVSREWAAPCGRRKAGISAEDLDTAVDVIAAVNEHYSVSEHSVLASRRRRCKSKIRREAPWTIHSVAPCRLHRCGALSAAGLIRDGKIARIAPVHARRGGHR